MRAGDGVKTLIRRWDDLAREFSRLARRTERQAHAALGEGHEVTASVGRHDVPLASASMPTLGGNRVDCERHVASDPA